jgi:hypothetical protein
VPESRSVFSKKFSTDNVTNACNDSPQIIADDDNNDMLDETKLGITHDRLTNLECVARTESPFSEESQSSSLSVGKTYHAIKKSFRIKSTRNIKEAILQMEEILASAIYNDTECSRFESKTNR